MFRSLTDNRNDHRSERDEMEPVLADESFEFLDAKGRPFKVTMRCGEWLLYTRGEHGNWKQFRRLLPTEVSRVMLYALRPVVSPLVEKVQQELVSMSAASR